MRRTSPENKERPVTPVSNALAGNILDKLSFHRSSPMESEWLCADAQRRTGLSDFGDPPVEPALSVLLKSLNGEARLHSVGRLLMRSHFRQLLETRLRLHHLWKTHAETVETSPLRRPIFITGIPRSGSTFLQKLLAEDSANRAPRFWEVMSPVSAVKPDKGWSDPRVWKMAARLWYFRRLTRHADTVYRVRARTPHECAAIHNYTFLSEQFISMCHIPGYEAFLRAADLRPAYVWQKRFLQHLQLDRSPKRWILKALGHTYGMEALFSVFPDALVIQINRNPLEVLPSMIQFAEVLHGLFANLHERDQVAVRQARILAASIDRLIQFRDVHPEFGGQFLDVHYNDLMADPMAVIHHIYAHFRLPWTRTTAWRMREFILRNDRDTSRKHSRRLTDARLDIPVEATRFDNYCRRFGVLYERARGH